MDNLTHSLAGMLLAEVVCSVRGEKRQHVRGVAYLVSALANNLPDIDILYSWMDGPKPLGSLLQHRGYTHTLLLALPMAWLLGLGVWRWYQKRHAPTHPGERSLIFALALLGPLFHLLLDFGNNYGVHPFWPVENRWFYGDSIFIVEPLWVAIAVPILARQIARHWLRLVLWASLGLLLVLSWLLPFVGTGTRLLLTATALLSFAVGRPAGERTRALGAWAAWVVVGAVFALGSLRAKEKLREAAMAAFPALSVHDIATAPWPGNPACWEALLAGEQGGTYRVFRATVALGSVTCGEGVEVAPTAPLRRLHVPERDGARFLTEYGADVAALARLRDEDCRFRALLRFARLPYVSGSGRVAGDLRYDREPGLDFSDVPLPESPGSGPCPRFVPGWEEPRAELFQR